METPETLIDRAAAAFRAKLGEPDALPGAVAHLVGDGYLLSELRTAYERATHAAAPPGAGAGAGALPTWRQLRDAVFAPARPAAPPRYRRLPIDDPWYWDAALDLFALQGVLASEFPGAPLPEPETLDGHLLPLLWAAGYGTIGPLIADLRSGREPAAQREGDCQVKGGGPVA
jgi:hypothetical protein